MLHSDAAAMAKHGNNMKITRNMSNVWPLPYTIDSAHRFISYVRNPKEWYVTANINSDSSEPEVGEIEHSKEQGIKAPHHWVIALDDELIGCVGADFQSDVHERVLTLGYWIGEEHWGKGMMTEVMTAFVQWVWDAYPVTERLEARVHGWNPASMRLLRTLGFKEEARLRAAVYKFGKRCDLHMFGLVKDGIEVDTEPPDRIPES